MEGSTFCIPPERSPTPFPLPWHRKGLLFTIVEGRNFRLHFYLSGFCLFLCATANLHGWRKAESSTWYACAAGFQAAAIATSPPCSALQHQHHTWTFFLAPQNCEPSLSGFCRGYFTIATEKRAETKSVHPRASLCPQLSR